MIIHIDMDAFYASVEIRDNPELGGLPVVVGGSPRGRGVVSAASYVAREFGIRSAMSAAQAIRLCPQAVFVRPRMSHYAAISRQLREIFDRYTSLVEPLSLDEAFLDVSGSWRLFGPAVEIAAEIRGSIQSELGLTASAGVAPNKFLAKVASDLDKPDGLVIVERDHVQSFLDPLPITRVWGIGRQTERKFNSLGVSTIGGIRQLPRDVLRRSFGIHSEHFWRLSRGLDSRRVVPARETKSVSHETTFAEDIDDREILDAWVMELAESVARRMRGYGILGRTVQVKIRFSDFQTITRSRTLDQPDCSTRLLQITARELVRQALQNEDRPVRLLGAGMTSLQTDARVQLDLFEQPRRQRDARLDGACDELKRKFGSAAVRSAAALQHDIHMDRRPNINDNPRPGDE